MYLKTTFEAIIVATCYLQHQSTQHSSDTDTLTDRLTGILTDIFIDTMPYNESYNDWLIIHSLVHSLKQWHTLAYTLTHTMTGKKEKHINVHKKWRMDRSTFNWHQRREMDEWEWIDVDEYLMTACNDTWCTLCHN